MLSPEVLNFKEPKSTFETIKANENICLHKINQFNYTHLLTVILPDTLKVPEAIKNSLNHFDYYKINKFNPSFLIDKEFIQNFVFCGNFNLININSRIDCDNCLSVTSCGKLVLNLNKVTFQSLGLEGLVSHFNFKNKEKFDHAKTQASPSSASNELKKCWRVDSFASSTSHCRNQIIERTPKDNLQTSIKIAMVS